jgi:uncharacterized membrane protein
MKKLQVPAKIAQSLRKKRLDKEKEETPNMQESQQAPQQHLISVFFNFVGNFPQYFLGECSMTIAISC